MIEFAAELPEGGGRYAHYDQRELERPGWRSWDLRPVARARQAGWLDAVDAWHRELCAAVGAVPGWWLSPGSRITAWYPVDLKPLFFALAAIEAAAASSTPLHLVGCPPSVMRYVGEATGLAPGRRGRPPGGRVVAGLRALAAHARRVLAHRSSPAVDPADLVVFSFGLDARRLGSEGDHYFGGLLDDLEQGSDVAWIYYLDRASEVADTAEQLRSAGRRSSFYFDWLSAADLAWIAREAVVVARALDRCGPSFPPLRVGGLALTTFSEDFHDRAVRAFTLSNELSVRRALGRAFAALKPKAIVYPYEEKGIERALLAARDATAPAAKTVAFAHAVYGEGHLYARHRASGPRPDALATTGDAASEWFRRHGAPVDSVVTVGSPRYISAAPLAPSVWRRDRPRLLFIVGYAHEPAALAQLATDVPGLLDRCELVVRRYPYAWPEQDEGIARLRGIVPAVRVEGGALDDQIRWADAVLFDSSSAGIHAMLRGRLAMSVALRDLFSSDPAAGKGDLPGFIRCEDAAELAAALETLRATDEAAYLALEAQQMRSAARIYSPPDQGAIASLLVS